MFDDEAIDCCLQVDDRSSRASSDTRKRLAPGAHEAFQAFSEKVFADGAPPAKTKQLIAVAVAHVTQCP
jgi:alkylhydroperoxidase/carboxymuconolactone decarboxylase family protein YurZ